MLQNLGTHRIPIGPDISGKKKHPKRGFQLYCFRQTDLPIEPLVRQCLKGGQENWRLFFDSNSGIYMYKCITVNII